MADDMRAAHAARLRAIGVVPPYLPYRPHAHTLMRAGALVVLSTPDDLPHVLGVLGGDGR
jgi:phosphoglycolate phosphatase-like HAD superfamily hydrolase